MGSQLITMGDIEAIFLQEPHVTRFVREDCRTPPIDFSMWYSRDRESARKYTGTLIDYLNSPYVEDDFPDHDTRREWRKQMAKKHPWFHGFYSKNPFRNNRIAVVIESTRALRLGYLGTNKNDLKSLICGIEEHRTDDSYHHLPQDDKREMVYGLKVNVLLLLTFLGYQTPQMVGQPKLKAA
jgi:hypothetical protein